MARLKARVQGGVQPKPPAKAQLSILAFPAIIFALAFTAYLPTLDAGWTQTDDSELIVEDAPFLGGDGAVFAAFRRPFFPQANRRSHYRPLVTATFAMDRTGGEQPVPRAFHLTNVLIHAAASTLVFFFVRALGAVPVVAAASAALFAVHPVTAQTVAWIPGRCDGLLAIFSLAALLAWSSFDASGSRRRLALHHLSFAAALFSKEAGIAIPFVAALYSSYVTRRASRLREPAVWVGWVSIAVAWYWARRSAVGGVDYAAAFDGALRNSPSLLVGLGKLVIPAQLDVLATLRDSSLIPGVVAVGLLAAAAWFVAPERRRLFIWSAVLLPLVFLAPALGVADYLILDNRLYLPLAGTAAGLAVLAGPSWQASRRLKTAAGILFGAAFVALAFLARRQAGYFQSPRDFCEAAVRGSPHLGLAHLNLGGVEYRDGHLDAAREDFERALRENPGELIAHNDLGLIFLNDGDLARAESEFSSELEVNPNYSKAHFNLGLVLERTGREEQAREHFERALELFPGDVQAMGELLKYWAPRDSARADAIVKKMEGLGVKFFTP